MPDGLYDRDILLWSEQQAGMLERLARGERVNDAVDWANLIDEVRDWGQSELRSCRSLLTQALVHLLKMHLCPETEYVSHWRSEAITFLRDASDRFTPSMRQRLDVDVIYQNAIHDVRQARMSVPEEKLTSIMRHACPFELDDLVSARPDIDALLSRLPF